MKRLLSPGLIFLALALALPAVDLILPREFRIGELMPPIFVFAILGLGLNIVTGFTGLLNLGVAAFMAIGAYSYAILTCELYPYRLGFWGGVLLTPLFGAMAGVLLGAPTLRLRGDYLAIVTLGFGEIVMDTLRNLDTITNGTQGINPLPYPTFFGYAFQTEKHIPWYYLYLALLALVVLFSRNLERSRIGRAWVSIREDELAAACMGVNPIRTKLLAFALGAAIASLAGALYASRLGSSGEPGNYDFAISIIALCTVIVGGMGSINGALLGAILIFGMDSIVLSKLSDYMQREGMASTSNVLSTPSNWKFMIYGLALILTMRFKPEGLLPSRRVKAEMHEAKT